MFIQKKNVWSFFFVSFKEFLMVNGRYNFILLRLPTTIVDACSELIDLLMKASIGMCGWVVMECVEER